MGEWKLLLPWAASTIVETVVASAIGAGLEALVVAGYRGDELHALLDGRPGVRVLDNPEWREGMLGSIQCALGAVRGEAFFVTPADMPGIGPSLYRSILEAADRDASQDAAEREASSDAAEREASSDAAEREASSNAARDGRLGALSSGRWGGIAYFAAFEGRAGHPVLVPSDRIVAMRGLGRGGKLRGFLQDGPWRLVETCDPAVLADVDTPEEYDASRQSLPTRVRQSLPTLVEEPEARLRTGQDGKIG